MMAFQKACLSVRKNLELIQTRFKAILLMSKSESNEDLLKEEFLNA
jgi:hypothetical protein